MSESARIKYNKVLVGRLSPKNGCHANDDEILILKPKKLAKDREIGHHFISSKSKMKSKYGWVKETSYFTFDDFKADFLPSEVDEVTIRHNKVMLDSINYLNAETPVAVTYSERIEPRRMELTVHRVIFYNENQGEG